MQVKFILLFFLAGLSCAVQSQEKQGDTIFVGDSKLKLVTTNLISNPGFEDGLAGWTDATTAMAPLTSANFSIYTVGGVGNSKFLVGTKNEGAAGAGSIGTGWSLESGKKYYFSYQVKYLATSTAAGEEVYLKISLTNDKSAVAEPSVLINSTKVSGGGQWTRNEIVFTNSTPAYSYLVARFRWLSNRFGFDNFSLYEVEELVNTRELESVIAEAQGIYDPGSAGAAELVAAISTAQNSLSSTSPTEVKSAVAALRLAILTYRLLNATPENPIDATHLIVNPSFDQNTPQGWKGIGVINNHVVEFYERTFNMYQKITGLPAGKYVLRAQGFERPKANDAGAAYRAGTEAISSRLYAKATRFSERNVPLASLFKHGYTGSGSQSGYVNSMAAAETFMGSATRPYENEVSEILLQEGDTLTIGVRNDSKQAGCWVLFDNFRLEYQGALTPDELKVAVDGQVMLAQGMLEAKMQTGVRTQLSAAIDGAGQDLTAVPLNLADLLAANSTLNDAYTAAQTSVRLYERLQQLIEEAEVKYPTLTGTKATNLLNAIVLARSRVNNPDVSTALLNSSISSLNAQVYKRIYVPAWMLGNVNDPNNTWSMARSKQSANWIVFWEPGYGEDPSVLADANFRINIDGLLATAEQSFDFYADSLKFIKRGRSKTDDYKMIIRLRYTRDWEATGSGVDDMIGLLTLTAWSAQVGGHTLAHEVGHCFQYQVHCDNGNQNGWMYGFGANASGGNGWWEQCAQWQAFKVFPNQQFTDGRFTNYLNTAHKHILHEAPRYDNYFIHDYFTFRQGMDIIGRMWSESVRPEDPVEAYKRITGINQEQFNDQMYDRAARFATWDIPALKTLGASRISARPQPKMINAGEGIWRIDPTVTPENYGYNVIKLNAPIKATTVYAFFEGKAGMDGYRKNFTNAAGWRYGFVALLTNGTRVYSDMRSASAAQPSDTLRFSCPDNCKQLWLVVSGAPSSHWRHAWDDDDTNDEQWPYEVKFNNTNLLGQQNIVNSLPDASDAGIELYGGPGRLVANELPIGSRLQVYNLMGTCVADLQSETSSVTLTLDNGVYVVSVLNRGKKFVEKIIVY